MEGLRRNIGNLENMEDIENAENFEGLLYIEDGGTVLEFEDDENSVAAISEHILEYPFALEWTISEDKLENLKDLDYFECLESDTFPVTTFAGVKYCLELYPDGSNNYCLGETMIFLDIEFEDKKKFHTIYLFGIETANWNSIYYDYTYSERNSLDFTIVVDKKEIKVHKNVFAAQSPVFYAMFNSGMKETIENKVEIIDFSLKTVEKAVELCYHQNFAADISLDEIALLLQFADKYDIKSIQNIIESSLGDKITVSNVCETANFAMATNCFKLQNE
uniref:BTB domain-containing protein n=1 Tax=Panagrolaimus sp. ES5 TaxID=591445 RepID=A0AC34G8P8_9BILA